MSEDERPSEPGPPPPPPPPPPPMGASAGGAPPFGPTPTSGPGPTTPAFSVQLPSVDVQALAKTPWVVGAAAILVGLVLYWAGSVVSAFQHDVGYDARQRLIHLLGAGDVDWAVAILLAVALLVLGSSGEAKGTSLATFLYQLLLLGAALITVAAAINAVIDLTYIGSSFDAAIYGFLQYLAAVPIAGAGVLWAWRANPVPLPGQKPKAK